VSSDKLWTVAGQITRRGVLSGGLTGAALLAAPAIVRADTPRRWRMVTSWSRNLLGPGMSAARLANRITRMSNGALTIDLFAAGEIVPSLAVFDAVANGTVELGHSASLFQQGKLPAAGIFTTVPFGLGPTAHAAWIDKAGQALWDQLYAPFSVKAFMAGNTGPSSAGWFRKAPETVADIAQLRIRVTGLGGEVYKRLGATPLAISPGDTYAALERGTIDAAEFLAPANDLALGLDRVAPVLAFPGFNKPNGASELLIGKALWDGLPEHLKLIIEAACRAEHDQGLAEALSSNQQALRQLVERGVKLHRLDLAILRAAGEAARTVLAEIASRDDLSRRIIDSYLAETGDTQRALDAMNRL
jgi:TRAP-type mannitol/chloroaromatic compound transport system substrate-binding protein